MPTKAKVLGQKFVPHPAGGPDGEKVSLTSIVITDATSTYLPLPAKVPTGGARVLLATSQSLPTFYLQGGQESSQVNIDGATLGTEYLVAARHSAFGGFSEE